MSSPYVDFLKDPDSNGPVPISGNDADDDAKYVDLMFEESQPPVPSEMPREEDRGGNVGIVIPNRLITRTEQFTGRLSAPVLILPADVNRKRLWLDSSVAVFWADNANALPAPSQNTSFWEPAYRLAFAGITQSAYELVGYTGALWVINSPTVGATSNWQVSIAAITE